MTGAPPKRGDKSADVRALQLHLKSLGLYTASIDDDFGGKTQDAVKAWQTRHWVDGTLEPIEWQSILAEIEAAKPKPPPAKPFIIPNGLAEIVERYGKPWDDVQGWALKWLAPCRLPDEFGHLHLRRNEIWVNRDVVAPLAAIFDRIADEGLAGRVVSFDGGWNVRKQRGSATAWSVHSWALAIDLNAATNALGARPTMPEGIVRAFEEAGWRWGGRFKRLDGMHFQAAIGC